MCRGFGLIGNRKDVVCLQLYGQVSRQPKHCSSAMLDPKSPAICCVSGSLLSDDISSHTATKDISEALKGDAFCKGMGLNPDQVQTCGKYVDQVLPLAMKFIFDALKEDSVTLCTLVSRISVLPE